MRHNLFDSFEGALRCNEPIDKEAYIAERTKLVSNAHQFVEGRFMQAILAALSLLFIPLACSVAQELHWVFSDDYVSGVYVETGADRVSSDLVFGTLLIAIILIQLSVSYAKAMFELRRTGQDPSLNFDSISSILNYSLAVLALLILILMFEMTAMGAYGTRSPLLLWSMVIAIAINIFHVWSLMPHYRKSVLREIILMSSLVIAMGLGEFLGDALIVEHLAFAGRIVFVCSFLWLGIIGLQLIMWLAVVGWEGWWFLLRSAREREERGRNKKEVF